MAKVLGFQIEIQGTQRAISTSEELRRAIADVGKELKKATDVETIQKLEKELVDLKARQNEVNKEVRESVKARQAELTGVKQTTGAYAALSKELNDTRKQFKDLAAAEMGSSEEAQVLLRRITQLDSKLKDIDGSVGQFQRNVGNYPKTLTAIVPGLDNIVDSIDNVRSATSGVGVGLGAIGVAFTAFNVVSGYVNDLNASLNETKKVSAQIQTFTKQTGEDLQNTVSQARAVAETYEQDVTEIVNAANAASKELGVSFNEAISSVELGLRKGANAQGEFLDSLREYSSQLGQAGFNIKEFTALAIDAAEKGVYSDKAIDAVKEFGLQTREQIKSVRDSFIAAFGEKFTNELFNNLNKGAISGRDALALVTKQIKDTGVAGKELQGLISTVFVGAGEDAGRYVLGLDDVLNRTDEILTATNSYQEGLKSVYQQNLELNKAQQEYNQLLQETGTTFQTVEIKAKTFFARTAAAAIDFADNLKASLDLVFFGDRTATDRRIQANADKLIAARNRNAKKQLDSLKTFGATQDVFQFGAANEKKAEATAEKTGEKVGTAIGKGYAKGAVKEIKQSHEEIAAELAAQNLAIEKQARAAFRAQISSIGEELQLVAGQLNTQGFADTILSGLGSQDAIVSQTASLAGNIVKEFDKIQPQLEEAAEKLFSLFTREIQQTSQDIANFIDNFQIEEVLSSALDIIGQFQQARAEREQEAFDAQIEQIDRNITALEEKQQNVGRIRAKQIQREIDQAKIQRQQAEEAAERAQKQAAKREKTLAIIQATIQGSLAVVRALAAPPGFPFNLPSVITTGVLAAAQVATIAAQPLATGGVVGISGRRVTDGQNMPTRSNGDNVLATVKRGEVVLNQRQQSALGGAGTFRSIGVPGFADGGAIGAPNIAATVAGGSDRVIELIEATNRRIDRIKVIVSSEEIRDDLAEGDALRANASL